MLILINNIIIDTVFGPLEVMETNRLWSFLEFLFLVIFFLDTAYYTKARPSYFMARIDEDYRCPSPYFFSIPQTSLFDDSTSAYAYYRNSTLIGVWFQTSIFFFIYDYLFDLIWSYFGVRRNKTRPVFYPIVSYIYFSIFFLSFGALLPSTEIVMSSALGVTFFSTSCLLVIIFYGIYKYRCYFVKLFLPKGLPGYLIKTIIYIEMLSFSARFVSLPLRIVANSLAAHLLLKIILGFTYLTFLKATGISKLFSIIIPLCICTVLFCLDILVIILQTAVFIFLIVLYMHEMFRSCRTSKKRKNRCDARTSIFFMDYNDYLDNNLDNAIYSFYVGYCYFDYEILYFFNKLNTLKKK